MTSILWMGWLPNFPARILIDTNCPDTIEVLRELTLKEQTMPITHTEWTWKESHNGNDDLVTMGLNALSGALSYRWMCYIRAEDKAIITIPANQNEFPAFLSCLKIQKPIKGKYYSPGGTWTQDLMLGKPVTRPSYYSRQSWLLWVLHIF